MTWSELFVGDLVDTGEAEVKTGPFGTQLKASDYVDEGTPVINVRNIGFGDIRPEKLEFIDEATVNRLSSHLLQNRDIVFGRKGAVERHAFIREARSGWFQGSDCLRLRIVEESRALPRFLSYVFLAEQHKQWMMQQCSHGATMASLNQDIIKRIPLRLPSISTQAQIIEVLSVYDDLIENNTRRIAILEEMARRLYDEWFVHFRFPGHEKAEFDGDLPRGWRTVDLGALVDDRRDAVHPDSLDPSTPYVGLEHIPRRSITLREWSEASTVQSTKLIFREDDILFGKIRPYFHKVVLASFGGVTSSDTIVLRAYSADHLAIAALCASSDAFVDYATQTSNGTKMPRADWKVLKSYPVAQPDNVLLARFNGFVLPLFATLKALNRKNANLHAQRDLLLPKLIAGEINVSESEAVLEAAE